MNESDDREYGDVGTALLFENQQVRVWELRLAPGQESDLHHHELDYLMVQVAGDRVAARFEPDSEGTFAGSDYLEGRVVPGAAIYARGGGRETAVNVGDEDFHEVVVELKAKHRRNVLPVQHVALSVTDAAEAIEFYTGVLGFELLERPELGLPGAWLETGNGIQLHILQDEGFVPPAGPHIAFETRDVDAEVERLRSLGVEVGEPFELNGVRQAFFSDPAGNQLELNQPPR
ncbi:MAG: VOC family protein [Microthrixaceae bacterium]|nr:VOC family protein [Microthrixaceae bacterium]MCO5318913.1 VOC family protein [Microthrixaceae bacterium]